ncbi:MAG: hypothetical protein IH859_04005, partial [Chloroflexi bacterium]|nr:hypothetical protein [Chloroflexota bacterium]
MIDIDGPPKNRVLLLGLMLIAAVFLGGISYVFSNENPAENETGSNNQAVDLAIDFGCTVWVEEVFPALGEDILVSVASYFDNMAPMAGVDGEVTIEFPGGEKALFYLPTT